MMYFLCSSLLSIALFPFSQVNGQTTLTVQVGQEGSFFDPSYVVAEVGDIISFVFSGDIHSVTQSTFENPCLPLEGGFNSGLAGKGTNASAPVPVWNLQITDASAPVWYFCAATKPSSHCAAGMVGVINPPNLTLFTEFQSVARAVSGTPTPTFAVTLSGVGAFATASPSDVSTMPPSASSETSSSSGAAVTTTTGASPSSGSNSNIGAIVGGAVGGSLGLVLILVILFWAHQRRKAKRRFQRAPREFDSSPKQSTNNFVDVDPDWPAMGQPTSNGGTHPLSAPTPTRTQFPLAHAQSFESQTPRSTVFSQITRSNSDHPSNITLQSLAQEVAAVLRQAPGVDEQHQYPPVASDGEPFRSRVQDRRSPEFPMRKRGDRDWGPPNSAISSPPPRYAALPVEIQTLSWEQQGGSADLSL